MTNCFIKYFHVGNIGDDLLALSLIRNTNFDNYYVVINPAHSEGDENLGGGFLIFTKLLNILQMKNILKY